MTIIVSLFFFIEVIFLLVLEKEMWKTYFTPTFFLLVPFLIVWLLVLFFAKSLGFKVFYVPSLFIWIIGIFVFWLPSLLLNRFLLKNKFHFSIPKGIELELQLVKNDNLIKFISLFIIGLFILHFFISIHVYGFNSIGSDMFGSFFAGSGFWGHLRVISMPIIIYHLVTFKNNWRSKSAILFVLFSVLFLYQVKGWILITVISAIILKIWLGQIKVSLKLLILIITFGLLVFFISYYFSLVVSQNGKFSLDFMLWVIKHFAFYLFSGVLGFSEYVKNDLPSSLNYNVIIAPVMNIVNKLLGQPLIDPINHYAVDIGGNQDSNVYSFFGTLYIWSGIYVGMFFTFIYGVLYYIVYLVFIMSRNVWLYIAIFFLIGLLSMGWFEFYLFHEDIIEIPMFCLIMALFFSNRKYIIRFMK